MRNGGKNCSRHFSKPLIRQVFTCGLNGEVCHDCLHTEIARLREIIASTTHERVVKAEEDVKKWREAAIDAGKLIKRGIHLMPPDRFRFNEWPGAVQWVEWIEQETGPESGKPN